MTMMMQAAPVAAKPEAMTVNSVRLGAELEARLLAVAARLGMRKSDVIRQALEELLAREEAVARAQAQAAFVRELDCAPLQPVTALAEAV